VIIVVAVDEEEKARWRSEERGGWREEGGEGWVRGMYGEKEEEDTAYTLYIYDLHCALNRS